MGPDLRPQGGGHLAHTHTGPECIPRPSRQRNPAESHLLISSHQGFWRRNLVCFCLAGSWCDASDHKFSKYDGRGNSFLHYFVLCSVFGLISGICYFPVFFVTFINATKLTLAANLAMPTSLAETSGGEKKWNALWIRGRSVQEISGNPKYHFSFIETQKYQLILYLETCT